MILSILLSVSTISSEGPWSFMRQPTNDFVYPSAVSSEHTFGSPDHTNGSRRVTREDLAAFETLFEAYYERMYFAAEGISNNWDTATFGPQVLSDDDLKYVRLEPLHNADPGDFAYDPPTRHMPGTMRLSEKNLSRIYDRVPGRIFESGAGYANSLVSRSTWFTQDRSVWWACSEFDFAEIPDQFDWTDSWPTSFVSNFVPICVFDTIGGTGHNALPWYPVIPSSVRHFAGPLLDPVIQRDEDWVTALGTPVTYRQDYRFMATNTIFSQFHKVFGVPEDRHYTGFIKRLVPDEYEDVITSWSPYDGSFITNAVYTNVSYQALASRMLAVHDRTMEVPMFRPYFVNSFSNREETCHGWAIHRSDPEEYSYQLSADGHTFRFAKPIKLGELSFNEGESEYSNSVVFSSADFTYDGAWFSGVSGGAVVSFGAFFEFRYPWVISCDLIAPLSPAPGREVRVPCEARSSYDYERDVVECSLVNPETGADFGVFHLIGARRSVLDSFPTISGSATIYVSRRCTATETTPPSLDEVRTAFPAYTPGFLGTKTRVRRMYSLFPCSVVVDTPTDDLSPMYPPFSYSAPGGHNVSLEYAFRVREHESSINMFTFADDYYVARFYARNHSVASVVPSPIRLAMPVGLGALELSKVTRECVGGTVSADVYAAVDVVALAFDARGRCIKVIYQDGTDSSHLVISFDVSLDAGASDSVPIVPGPRSGSATSRVSAGIVADWDFHALKLSHDDK